MSVNEKRIVNMFNETGALLSGHFKLSSGLHSEKYLQCALVLQYPEYAKLLGEAIAAKVRGLEINCVAAPALGGIIIGHEVARALGKRCIFGEREEGKMALRRGFSAGEADKILAVEDVITTGKSIKELITVLRARGSEVIGVGSIIDRSSQALELGCGFYPLVKMQVNSFQPDSCPLCKDRTPIVKPGSRA